MPVEPSSSLSVQLASRLVIDSVSYSNALPPWNEMWDIDFVALENKIRKKIRAYLSGGQRPTKASNVSVPTKSGMKKKWLLPSVTDQIIVQAAVSALAPKIASVVDLKHVMSYPYNSDPNRVQLTNSQISSWVQFQNQTTRRLSDGLFVLQIDLQGAFQSINRAQFWKFLQDTAPSRPETDLLRIVIEGISSPNDGLPLMNDSVFFLGNAYLRIVDELVGQYTKNFIRFVDDYRIFADSPKALDRIFEKLNGSLASIGFKINMSKVRLGSGQEYFDAIAKVKHVSTDLQPGYISAAIFDDIITPEDLITLIEHAINKPEELINEGFGRLLMGAVRKLSINSEVMEAKNYYRERQDPAEEVHQLLRERKDVIGQAEMLLRRYASDPNEDWRATCLIYIVGDFLPEDTMNDIRTSKMVGPITRLWARRSCGTTKRSRSLLELVDLDYLDEGREPPAMCSQ